MAGSGTGVPIWFACPVERREVGYAILVHESVDAVHRRHVVRATGTIKPWSGSRGHHPRLSWTSFRYDCSCGHSGWSAHKDLERMAVRAGDVTVEEIVGHAPSDRERDEIRKRYRSLEP